MGKYYADLLAGAARSSRRRPFRLCDFSLRCALSIASRHEYCRNIIGGGYAASFRRLRPRTTFRYAIAGPFARDGELLKRLMLALMHYADASNGLAPRRRRRFRACCLAHHGQRCQDAGR